MAMVLRNGQGFCENCEAEFESKLGASGRMYCYHLRADEVIFNKEWKDRFAKCSCAGRYFRMPVLVEDFSMGLAGHPEKPAAASGSIFETCSACCGGGLVPSLGVWGSMEACGECKGTGHKPAASGLGGEAAAKLKAAQEATWMPMVGRAPVQGGEVYRGTCFTCDRPMIEHGPNRECPSPANQAWAKMRAEQNTVPMWPKTAEAEKSEALFRSFPDPGKNSSSAPPVADAVPTHTRTVNSVLVADTAAMVRQALMGYTLTPAVADKLILALAGEIHRVTLGDWSAESKLHVTAKIPNSPAPKEFRREITFTILDGNPARVLGSGITPTYDEADAILGELLHTAHGWIPKVTVKFQPEVGNQPKTLTDEQLFGDPVQPTQRPIDIGMDGVPHVSEPLAAASVSAVDRIQDVTDQVMARYPAASGGVSKPIEFEKGEPDDFSF